MGNRSLGKGLVLAEVSEVGAGIPPQLLRLLTEQVEQFGSDAVCLALENTYLFDSVRALSRLSLRTAAVCAEEGFPATVVTKINPKAKNRGERVEIRAITGDEIAISGS